MSLGNILLLIITQVVWSSSYVAMKIGIQSIPPSMVVFLRYFFVVMAFIPFWLVKGFPKLNRKIILASLAVGIANFYGSPMLQVFALKYTQATDASILILFEPLLTVLMAFLILKERVSKHLWKVLLFSMIGFFLISDIHFGEEGSSLTKMRLFGNTLFFGSIFFEALCSITGKYFTKKNKPWNAMGLLMASGLVFCFLVHSSEIIHYDYLTIPAKTWAAILFLSVGCSLFGYIAWYIIIEKIPVQYVAMSLFLQPIFGSFFGYVFFRDVITVSTVLGAGTIIMALIWWQRVERKSTIKKSIQTVSN